MTNIGNSMNKNENYIMGYHTKRKFVGNVKLDFEMEDAVPANYKPQKNIDYEKYTKAFLQLEDKTMIAGFVYLHNGKPIIIPEPEPSILYFTNAESKLIKLLELQEVILQFKLSKHSINDLSHIFFNFFQSSSDYIINLFTSIEAYNNGLIPDDFEIIHKNEKIGKEKIQRSMDFATKFKKVIPKIKEKSFIKEFPKDYEYILELKNLRDNVIHTKNMQQGFPASYRELYKSYLDFDFMKSYEIIKKYFNYYTENWIEKCDCGK